MIRRFNAHSSAASWAEFFGQALETQPTPEPMVKMFEHFAHHERLYRALLGKRGSSWFVTKTRASLASIFTERLQALAYALGSKQIAESRVFADGFVPALLAAQLVDAITWWLEQGRPYTTGQIATYWYRLMCSTLREVSVWE
jgi:hypothetical protein